MGHRWRRILIGAAALTGLVGGGLAVPTPSGPGVSFARVSDDRYHTALYVGGNGIVEATGDQVQLSALGQWGSGGLMPNGRRP